MNLGMGDMLEKIRLSSNDLQSIPVATFVIEKSVNIVFANAKAVELAEANEAGELADKDICKILKIDREDFRRFVDEIENLGAFGPADIKLAGKAASFQVNGASLGGHPGTMKIIFFQEAKITPNDSSGIDEKDKIFLDKQRLIRPLASALDNFYLPAWICDLEGKFKYFNPAWLSFTGQESVQNTGENWFDLIHHDDIQDFLNQFKENIAKRANFFSELRLKDKNGKYQRMQFSITTYADHNGTTIGYIGCYQDVNHYEDEINRLNKEKERLEIFINLTDSIHVALDKKGRIVMINEPGCRMLGKEKKDLIGADWFELCIPEDERAKIYSVFLRIIGGKESMKTKTINKVMTKNGLHVVSWKNTTVRDNQGKIVGTFSIGHDVSEEELREKAVVSKTAELERFNQQAIGRELKMIKLKNRIKELENELNRPRSIEE